MSVDDVLLCGAVLCCVLLCGVVLAVEPDTPLAPERPNAPEVELLVLSDAAPLVEDEPLTLFTLLYVVFVFAFDVVAFWEDATSVCAETTVPPLTTGVVAVVVAPYSVEDERVEELQPARARPAREEMKIIFFIGRIELTGGLTIARRFGSWPSPALRR